MSCATPIPPSGPLGHVPEMTGHVAEIAGHDPETVGHVRPKYANSPDLIPTIRSLGHSNTELAIVAQRQRRRERNRCSTRMQSRDVQVV
ncbi:hypothetical protein FOB31_16240 [Burkholderia multivorans]|nr:hypothetical protein FOB31_16240 [Burkholderia multivorans]QET41325.1 hypothetical protein FOB30_27630 [Burkholderia multivorans]